MLIFKSQIGSFHPQLQGDLRFKRRLAPALFCRGHRHPSPVERSTSWRRWDDRQLVATMKRMDSQVAMEKAESN
jgi:hypothetical protein